MTSKVVEDRLPCPHCNSSDAYHVYDDGHGYCFSCKYHSASKREASEYTYQYLPWRGILASTYQAFDAKTKVDSTGKPVSIGFRYPCGNIKVRPLESKDFYWQKSDPMIGTRPGLFGRDKFAEGSRKYVTITEGELDALSLYQVLGAYPVVSVQSASTARRDCTADHAWLNSFERIYLAFDNDEAGREARDSVAKLFDYNKVFVVKFSNRKDANEYLQAGEAEELRRIWWNSKKYLPETVISDFSDFRKILQEPLEKGVPYPFPTLNEMTYGIRRGEVVLLTAQEGIGKTELMHAIEYQLLKETDDAIGAIFLEEPKQRHLLAVAGAELQRPVHLPDYNRPTNEVISALEAAIRVDGRLHIYSHFGSDDPAVLLDTIRFLVSARSCVYVLLDHISMVVSGLAGEDERKALDYISTQLAMMVKSLNFSLIIVSHVNDEGQTRGSRFISKIADIRIDANRYILSPDPVIRNTTYLNITKNRFSGKTGPCCAIVFDPDTWTFKEEGNGDHLQGQNINPQVYNPSVFSS